MNNLLMREIPLRCSIRLWDTFLVSIALSAFESELVIDRETIDDWGLTAVLEINFFCG